MSKLSDSKRFKLPYRNAEASRKPGYLKERLRRYADLQQEQAQQTQRVVRPLRKAAK